MSHTASAPIARARRLVRRHWLFAFVMAAGAALRVVTMLAYQPALLGGADANSYLDNAAAEDLKPLRARPIGYVAFLRTLPLHEQLWLVPLLQHALALAMAGAIYALLLRLGVLPWLAALAAAPVLLDGWQLLLGQYVMSETLYETLLLGGAAALLWRSRLSLGAAALAGLLFAGVALTRGNGIALFLPALVAAVLLRARPPQLVAMVACFVIPVGAYAVWFESVYGVYGITGYSGRFLYARVAPFVDCSRLDMPARERVLCPEEPLSERRRVNWYMWSKDSPQYRLQEERWDATASFARRAIRAQPLDYAETVLRSAVGGFAIRRGETEGATPFENWRFQAFYPTYKKRTAETLRAYGYRTGGRADPELAGFLRGYQAVVYPPGPLMALALALGALGALGVGRARRSGLRTAAFLFSALGVVVLLTTVAVNALSWRYWAPELVLLPPAGALGLTALLGGRRPRPPSS